MSSLWMNDLYGQSGARQNYWKIKVYLLSGIFDIQIPLYYSKEGAEDVYRRLREAIDKREKCMRDLYITDPCDDKKRVDDTKGGLLEDLFRWVLENSDF